MHGELFPFEIKTKNCSYDLSTLQGFQKTKLENAF